MEQLREQIRLKEIEARQQAIEQLETDVGDIHQVYRDLARIAHDENEIVDSIEANIGQTVVFVEQGRAHAQQAVDYQKKARRKKMFCVLMFLVLSSLVAALTYVWFR